MVQNVAKYTEGILVNGSHDLKTAIREMDLKQANYFHKGFLTNLNKEDPDRHISFVFFYQNAIPETTQVKPLTLMVSTKSAHLLPDNSLEALNGFYCTWKPVKFRWKHFSDDNEDTTVAVDNSYA